MKKTKLFITVVYILGSALNNSINAQDADANCIEEGKIMIDGDYGYPYVGGYYVKAVFSTGEFHNVESVINMNHVGGKFEYMITDRIGLGVEYTHAAVHVNYKVDKSNQNKTETYYYRATLTKHRILARFNYHFATTDKLDPYVTAGIGYKVSRLKSNNIDDQLTVAAFNAAFSNYFPIAYRLGIGMRYFFIPNFGFNLEAGIGGPFVQAGITGKF